MRYVLALIVAACGSTPAPTTTATLSPSSSSSELTPALAPLAWILGDWIGERGSEHWVAASGAIYGIALQDSGRFEVMVVDDAEKPGPADGVVRFLAMPGGMKSVEFRAETIEGTSAVFANPAHDSPKKIGYTVDPSGLRATLHADANRVITFDFRPGKLERAADIEAADLAFSADVQKRGVVGWSAAFAIDGAMMSKDGRVTGGAIGDMMKPILESGALVWAPIASGKRGTFGYTVGKATFTGKTPADSWRSTYVSIWRKGERGWQVVFDTGRPVNE